MLKNQVALQLRKEYHVSHGRMDSPPLDQESLDRQIVEQKFILDILFHSQLSFSPLLSQSVARGWTRFVDFFHAAETGGSFVPILASQVTTRLHLVVLHAGPFIAAVPGVFGKLNQLQWRWGKTILGCRYQHDLTYHLVTAQCA